MTDAQHGDEGRRQAYLAALGIPLWSARAELPGALPSVPLAFVPFLAEVAIPVAPAPSPAAAQGAGPMPANAARVTAPASAAPVTASAARAQASAERATPAAGEPDSAAAAASGEAVVVTRAGRPAAANVAAEAPRRPAQDERFPRLSCRAWTLAPGMSAVVALDDAPDLSAAEYHLLDNIARALEASEMPAAVGELLRWPLNRNPALDHGPGALHIWLGHALRLPPGRCVVFGEALAWHVSAALPGTVVVAAPALGELLADAGAKRRLWQALNG